MEILINCALSLDGKLGKIGEKTPLSNSEDWKQVHLIRERFDSVMVGAQTIRIDNPSLKVKEKHLGRKPKKQPTRIILTATGNIPQKAKIFDTPPKTIIVTTKKGREKLNKKEIPDIQIITYQGKNKLIPPEFVIQELEKKGINSLLIEGGARVITNFLNSSLKLKIRIFVSPIILGGENTVPFVIKEISRHVIIDETYVLGNGVVIKGIKND